MTDRDGPETATEERSAGQDRRSQASISDAGQVVAAYSRWAPVYDLAFAAVMRAGRLAAAAAASRAAAPDGTPLFRGGRVIDIGVGTGLELPMFAPHARIVGIDLSEAMLRRARDRVMRTRLGSVEGLLVMDATRLALPGRELRCRGRPLCPDGRTGPASDDGRDPPGRAARGGEIVLVNHFGADRGPLALAEAWLGRHSASLGWHPQFPFSVLGDWVAAHPDIAMLERRAVQPFGLFTLVRLKRAG